MDDAAAAAKKAKVEEAAAAESAQQTTGPIVHGAGTAWEHTHGPTGAKICGLGAVTVGGATFVIDREGQVEAGLKTEFGVEHIAGAADVKPTACWLANPDGKKLCEPVEGVDHEPMPGEGLHWHFNLQPLYPVKKSKLVIQVGEEVFYNYGSDKPFEHIRKRLQEERNEVLRKKASKDVCRLVWVLHDAEAEGGS